MSEKKNQAVGQVADGLTGGAKIWEEIKNLPIDVYGIAGQRVSQHITKIDLPANELYAKMNSTAVLPALETSLGKKFSVELAEKYIIISKTEDRDSKVDAAVKQMKQRELEAAYGIRKK